MKHAATRMLFDYWDRLRGERAAPDRGEIEPGEIRHILADTFILELGPDRSPELRLAGTRMCAFFGGELRGRRFDHLWAEEARNDPRRWVDIVVDETAGVVAGLTGSTAEGERADLELILLPLRHRGRPHARVLGALSPAAAPFWIGLKPLAGLRTTSLRIVWPSGRIPALRRPGEAIRPERRLVVHQGGLSGG